MLVRKIGVKSLNSVTAYAFTVIKVAEGTVVLSHAVNVYGRVEVELYPFLTSVISGS